MSATDLHNKTMMMMMMMMMMQTPFYLYNKVLDNNLKSKKAHAKDDEGTFYVPFSFFVSKLVKCIEREPVLKA